eukprot:GFYU01006266.1.p2 GENE.GFYU01006266.1~~GFYU01006266.1.p2  ORF type:complete len:134 (+),score=11.34 GFYU01006266.1:162-563(+)
MAMSEPRTASPEPTPNASRCSSTTTDREREQTSRAGSPNTKKSSPDPEQISSLINLTQDVAMRTGEFGLLLNNFCHKMEVLTDRAARSKAPVPVVTPDGAGSGSASHNTPPKSPQSPDHPPVPSTQMAVSPQH